MPQNKSISPEQIVEFTPEAELQNILKKNKKKGFRLNYAEVLNWGTFDGKIFKISPSGDNSLMTGANGSGKTTYIDAILTLLVPEMRHRFYNQSSGSKSKKERTEDSYITGNFMKTINESEQSINQALRPDKNKIFSVILGNFVDSQKKENITLIQVRWYSQSELKRAYIVTDFPLTIADISPFDTKGDWKKNLKKMETSKKQVNFYDTAVKYSNQLRKVFGMKSEKAQTLFNQTVGLKVLGDLNDFIRQNMIEENDIEEDFIRLKSNYNNLLNAHKSIEKAREQLKLLEPIKINYEKYQVAKENINSLSLIKNILDPYFTKKEYALTRTKVFAQENEARQLEDSIKSVYEKLQEKRNNEASLNAKIMTDETGKLIAEIEKDIKSKIRDKDRKEKELKKYNNLAEKLNFIASPSNPKIFLENITNASIKLTNVEEEIPQIRKKSDSLLINISDANKAYDEKNTEYENIKKGKNNISGRVSDIRDMLIEKFSLLKEDLPFVGEIIQVKESQKKWEYAIEKVLHNFALTILVPESEYSKINNFVNNTDLKGRIVYYKVESKKDRFNSAFKKDENKLIGKIEIKPDSDYYDWLTEHISKNFDYVCTKDLDEFKRCSKAITPEGLIKNFNKHEKDDRDKKNYQQNYVLGWDNKDKLKMLEKQINELLKEISSLEKERKSTEKIFDKVSEDKTKLEAFKNNFESFDEIDVLTTVKEIQKLTDEKNSLEKSNNKLKDLKKQLENLRKEIELEEKENLKLSIDKGLLEKENLSLREKMISMERFLSEYPGMEKDFDSFEKYYKGQSLEFNLENIEKSRDKFNNIISKDLSAAKDNENNLANKIQNFMREFKRPDESLILKFPDWTSDTHKLSDDLKYISEYIEMFEKISKDDLPRYDKTFKKYLNEDMINKMTDFTQLLYTRRDEIKESIDILNKSLKRISFKTNPDTYIQLKHKKSELSANFEIKLKSWRPNIGEYEITKDDSILEKSFEKIKEIIEELDKNERYRKEATDVRNWFIFTAQEFFKEDNKLYKLYESTGELSGGEKAQLTYTILGSAIAYQFGINQESNDSNSFRFIIIDESFSNQDDEKSTYLMNLCEQLELQLLVVTPNDKTHIVEPFISHVHFTQRQNDRNSILFDMPISQYIEERENLNII